MAAHEQKAEAAARRVARKLAGDELGRCCEIDWVASSVTLDLMEFVWPFRRDKRLELALN